MTYDELKKIVEAKNYLFFSSGVYNLNFIWVRMDLQATNHFTDKLYVAYLDPKQQKQVLDVFCTTKPGLKDSLYNPKTVDGVTGTAIIQEAQYRGTWEFRDTTAEFSSYPYFRQIKPVNYFRDGDKDNTIDEINEQHNKIYGTHWHRMSNFGDKRKVENYEVNNWSQGCMGSVISEWDKVIAITRESVKLYGNKFTGTIITGEDLKVI